MAELDDEYISKMEDVLEAYEKPYDPAEPVVCLDEKPVTLHADVRPVSPAKPEREARRDNNLIAWGDSLFQQYTIETINEATQIYILAANILGTKPQAVPKKGSVSYLTYNQLRGNLDAFSNALVDMEVDIPFDLPVA